MIILDATSEGKKHADFWHKLSKNVDASKAIDDKLTKLFGISYNLNFTQKNEEHCRMPEV